MSAQRSADQDFPRPRLAWYMVGVLMLCYTLSYADRQILAFLRGPLKHDLGVTDTQFGLLQGAAFALVYTFFGLPMGALADRFSRRNLVALGVVIWSLATSLSSVARSFVLLGAARMGVGLGEATLSPCAFSMITDSFPKERLSTAVLSSARHNAGFRSEFFPDPSSTISPFFSIRILHFGKSSRS